MLTPGLLADGPPLDTPADLRRHTLLHETNRDSWAQWFNAAGLPELAQQRGPIFPDASFTVQAAKLGHGIALGDQVMEGDDLEAGNLIRPFDLEVSLGAYWLVAPDFKRLSAPAKAFSDWALAEFRIKRPFDTA